MIDSLVPGGMIEMGPRRCILRAGPVFSASVRRPRICRMGVTYYKRFRMEIDVGRSALAEAVLPAGYQWVAWDPALLERHAQAKFEAFRVKKDAALRSESVIEHFSDRCIAARMGYEKIPRVRFLRHRRLLVSPLRFCLRTVERSVID